MHRPFGFAAALSLVVSFGCAGFGWDGVLQLGVAPVPLPAEGESVWIEPVEDARVFRASSPHPWEPTVFDGDPLDLADTARVIGRRFEGPTGNRGGNVTLPEGTSAAGVARDALVRAFRTAGYRAGADPETAASPGTVAVSARLLEFWVRAQPTYGGTIRYEARTRLHLGGDAAGLPADSVVCGRGVKSSAGRSRSAWERAVDLAVSALVEDVSARLGAPGVEPPGWRCAPSLPSDAPDGVLGEPAVKAD